MSASEAEKKIEEEEEEEAVKGGELSEEDHQGSQLSESEKYLVGFVTNIVGLKHYSATITGNEILGLVREPLNPSDSNAIKVLNTQSLQVGYIERPVTAVLSPLINAQIIAVEGLVRSSPRLISNFRIPIQVRVFASFSSFGIVHDAFNQSLLHFIAYTDPSFTLSRSIAVKETRADNINGNINTIDTTTSPNSNAKNLDEVFKLVRENLIAKKHVHEVHSPPDGIIKSALLQHQKEGLAWLFQRENSGELPPFWEEKEGNFVNVLTHYQTRTRPEPLRGGIFADGMGLGKTLTFLSLIAYDKMQRKCGGKRRRSMLESKGTLVVCPPSVISTWITQLEEHSCCGAPKTYIYYGDKRTEDFEELGKYDLVLTTYATLGVELTWPDSPVKNLEWWRIVLDEAHTIKNVNAGQSKAVIALKAKRRWAVTGTPIQNGSYDLFSLMAFLHFEPFSIKGYWQSLVQRPLNQGEQIGLTRLQV